VAVLGCSGIEVFAVALGANTFGWTSSKEVSFQVLDAFGEGGGNFIDTADVYSAWVPGNPGGVSESIIGEWVSARSNRSSVVIATKVSEHPEYPGLSATNIVAAAHASLRRLQTDYIDLYYAHYDDPSTPLEETVHAFDRLVVDGVVRSVGISNYSPERIAQWVDIAGKDGLGLPAALQPHYNLLVRKDVEREVLPLALEHQLAVVPYRGLAGGFLSGKYRSAADAADVARKDDVADYLNERGFAVAQEVERVAKELGVEPASVALAWLRSRPAVVAPIASASRADQVASLMTSATLTLTDNQLARLGEASDAFGG
jgi:aryl-alcohol dehydrogenase (NADP+)